MSKVVPLIVFVAHAPGFYNGARVRAGGEITAPEDETFSWAKPKDGPKAKAKAKDGEPAAYPFLDRAAKDIVPEIKDATDAELKAHLAHEKEHQKRKGVLTALDDEIASRVGEVPDVTAERERRAALTDDERKAEDDALLS